ncbi:hypothetical protein OAG68_00535 [bacterium]|nr:hypothetical protein [bacterium]
MTLSSYKIPNRFFAVLGLACIIPLFVVAQPAHAQQSVEIVGSVESDSANKRQEQEETKAPVDESKLYSEHMRIRRDGRGRAIAMDTAVTRFELLNEDGKRVHVDLIGAVHIGEKEYYQALNDRFEKYDAMLYELVAPEGTVIPKGGGGRDITNPVAAMQVGMMSGLDLTFQLEEVDYTKDNFVHADMTPEEFAESWSKNNESLGRILLKSIGQSMAMQQKGGASNLSLLSAMLSDNPTLAMRRIAAEQMANMDAGMSVFEGDNGSTIIDHRNAKVIEVLQRELDKGTTKIAIFYGAGHLKDLQRRLESDLKMKRGGKTWLEAWKLREEEKK